MNKPCVFDSWVRGRFSPVTGSAAVVTAAAASAATAFQAKLQALEANAQERLGVTAIDIAFGQLLA